MRNSFFPAWHLASFFKKDCKRQSLAKGLMIDFCQAGDIIRDKRRGRRIRCYPGMNSCLIDQLTTSPVAASLESFLEQVGVSRVSRVITAVHSRVLGLCNY